MDRGLGSLIIPHWAWKASSLNPHLGQRRYPINTALGMALEKVGLRLELLKGSGGRKGLPGAEDSKGNPAENRCLKRKSKDLEDR
jgi:hypothetical protein